MYISTHMVRQNQYFLVKFPVLGFSLLINPPMFQSIYFLYYHHHQAVQSLQIMAFDLFIEVDQFSIFLQFAVGTGHSRYLLPHSVFTF